MHPITSAFSVVLRETFRPIVGVHGTAQLIIAAIVYLSIPVVPTALSVFFRSDIPLARDFDPLWTLRRSREHSRRRVDALDLLQFMIQGVCGPFRASFFEL